MDRIAYEFSSRQTGALGVPAVTTYTVRPQRSAKSGKDRTAICIGHLQGHNVEHYLNVGHQQDGFASILQVFVPTVSSVGAAGAAGGGIAAQNTVVMVKYTKGSVQMHKLMNRRDMWDTNTTLKARTVTIEVEPQSELVMRSKVPTDSQLSIRLRKAVREIIRHVTSVASVSVTAGNFYFKEPSDGGKIVLLFAAKIQTDPKLAILIDAQDWVICPQDHQVELVEQESIQKLTPGVTIDDGVFFTDYELVKSIQLPENNGRTLSSICDQRMSLSKQDDNKVSELVSIEQTQRNSFVRQSQRSRTSPTVNHYLAKLVIGECARCEARIQSEKEDANGINAAIVIRLQEYYERHPAGLLLLPASSAAQQRFYEEVYAQVQGRHTKIPVILQQVFALVSDADYNQLRHDPEFLYYEFKLCEACWDGVKKMQVYQSNEHSRQTTPVTAINNLAQINANNQTQINFASTGITAEDFDRAPATPRRLIPLVQPPVVPQGLNNQAQRQQQVDGADFVVKPTKAVMSVQKMHSSGIQSAGMNSADAHSLLKLDSIKGGTDRTKQHELISSKIDDIKQQDLQFTISLKELNEEMEQQKGKGLRIRTANQQGRTFTQIENRSREQQYQPSSEPHMPLGRNSKASRTSTSKQQSSPLRKSKTGRSEAAYIKRARLSQKLEVKREFEIWKEKGQYYEAPETVVKTVTPHLAFYNPQAIRSSQTTMPRNVLVMDQSKAVVNAQQQKRVKKARATSAKPARIRDHAAQQLFGTNPEKSGPQRTDYAMRRFGTNLMSKKSKNNWIDQRSHSLSAAGRVYAMQSQSRTNMKSGQGSFMFKSPRKDSSQWHVSQINTEHVSARKKIAAQRKQLSQSGSQKTMTGNKKGASFVDRMNSRSSLAVQSSSAAAYFNEGAYKVDTSSVAVRSSATAQQVQLQLQAQLELADRLQKLNADTQKTLLQVESNAEGIFSQLKEIRSESQDLLRASSDAASRVAAAKQGIVTQRSEPASEAEWIDLSQELNTITSRGVDLNIPESNAESREQMDPVSQIVNQSDLVATSGFKIEASCNDHESANSGPGSQVTGSEKKFVVTMPAKEDPTSAQYASNQSSGVFVFDHPKIAERQSESQPIFSDGLEKDGPIGNASSIERQSVPYTANEHIEQQVFHVDLNEQSDVDAIDMTMQRDIQQHFIAHQHYPSNAYDETASLETTLHQANTLQRKLTEKESVARTESTYQMIKHTDSAGWECGTDKHFLQDSEITNDELQSRQESDDKEEQAGRSQSAASLKEEEPKIEAKVLHAQCSEMPVECLVKKEEPIAEAAVSSLKEEPEIEAVTAHKIQVVVVDDKCEEEPQQPSVPQEKQKELLIRESQVIRSVVEVPIHEPLLEAECAALAPQAEPHASQASAPTPDRDSQTALLSEPELHGTQPSEGRVESALDAPSPSQQLKAPTVEEQDKHIDLPIDTPYFDAINQKAVAAAVAPAHDPFGSHLGTEQAEGLVNMALFSDKSQQSGSWNELIRTLTPKKERPGVPIISDYSEGNGKATQLACHQGQSSMVFSKQGSIDNYKSQETIVALKVSEKLSKHPSQLLSQEFQSKVQEVPTFELWEAEQAPMSPSVADYMNGIFDSAVNRFESSEHRQLQLGTPDFNFNYWDDNGTYCISPTVEEYISMIYDSAIDKNQESERLRTRQHYKLWEAEQAPMVEEYMDRIYSSALRRRAGSELRIHQMEEKLWAEAAMPALVDDYLSEVYLRALSHRNETIVPEMFDGYLSQIYQSVLQKHDFAAGEECRIEASISEIFESAAAKSETSMQQSILSARSSKHVLKIAVDDELPSRFSASDKEDASVFFSQPERPVSAVVIEDKKSLQSVNSAKHRNSQGDLGSTGSKRERINVTKTVSEATGKKMIMASVVETSSHRSKRFEHKSANSKCSNAEAVKDLPKTQIPSQNEDMPELNSHDINIPLQMPERPPPKLIVEESKQANLQTMEPASLEPTRKLEPEELYTAEPSIENYRLEEEEKVPDEVIAHMQIDDDPPNDTITNIRSHFEYTESTIVERRLSDTIPQQDYLTFQDDLQGIYSDIPDKSIGETAKAYNKSALPAEEADDVFELESAPDKSIGEGLMEGENQCNYSFVESASSEQYGHFVPINKDMNYNIILKRLDALVSQVDGMDKTCPCTLEKGKEIIDLLEKLAQEGKLDMLAQGKNQLK